MTSEEKKVIEFLVQDVKKHQKSHVDELETPSFDEVYQIGPNRTEPAYKQAVEYARAYCTFYSNKDVRTVRTLARKLVSLSEIKPQIAQMLSEAHEPDFVLNIRRALEGIVYEQMIETGDELKKAPLYTDAEGVQLENYEPGQWQIVFNETEFSNIDTYYKLFNDQYLWVKLSKSAIENNAKTLIGPLTAHISLFELALKIDAQYPFAQVVNDEKAIVIGLECDFENDDINLILAEPGGKLSYISSKNIDDVSMVGSDQITKEPISTEKVAEDFGLIVDCIPEKVIEETPEDDPDVVLPHTTEGQYKGFNRPEQPNVDSRITEEEEQRPPHENFGTLGMDALMNFDAKDFAADYGDNYKNSASSGSYSFEDGQENMDFDMNPEEDDEDEEFDDVDNTYDDSDFN